MAIQPGLTLIKDPDAVLPYEFDWSEWLDAAEIDTSDFIISGADSGLAEDSASVLAGNTSTRIVLSGGTVGVKYRVTNRIVTNETPARTDDRSFFISVKER